MLDLKPTPGRLDKQTLRFFPPFLVGPQFEPIHRIASGESETDFAASSLGKSLKKSESRQSLSYHIFHHNTGVYEEKDR